MSFFPCDGSTLEVRIRVLRAILLTALTIWQRNFPLSIAMSELETPPETGLLAICPCRWDLRRGTSGSLIGLSWRQPQSNRRNLYHSGYMRIFSPRFCTHRSKAVRQSDIGSLFDTMSSILTRPCT